MRTQAMSSRMLYNRPLPISRIVGAIADSASLSTPRGPIRVEGRRLFSSGLIFLGRLLAQRPKSTRSTTAGDRTESDSSSPDTM